MFVVCVPLITFELILYLCPDSSGIVFAHPLGYVDDICPETPFVSFSLIDASDVPLIVTS